MRRPIQAMTGTAIQRNSTTTVKLQAISGMPDSDACTT